MTERKALSSRTRFDVFKRDGFVCQYCGAHPPGAILHIDHVVPVALGGTNDTTNLVTSCDACNLGKAAEPLSSIPRPLKANAEDVREREAQIRGYQDAMRERATRLEAEVEAIADIYAKFNPQWELSPRARVSVRSFVEKIGYHDVAAAMEKACASHVEDGQEFRYFCGICWNLVKGR